MLEVCIDVPRTFLGRSSRLVEVLGFFFTVFFLLHPIWIHFDLIWIAVVNAEGSSERVYRGGKVDMEPQHKDLGSV